MRDCTPWVAGQAPVVREDPCDGLRVVPDPSLDVPGNVRVKVSPLRTWQRRVRDVPDQRVPEAVLDVPLEAARVLTADKIASLQLVERLIHGLLVGDLCDDVPPEASPDDRRREEHRSKVGRQHVEARRDRSRHGHREACSGGAVRERRAELLDEERVPFRDCDQPVDGLTAPRGVADELLGKLPRLIGVKRIEDDARVRGQPRPPRALVEELRPREDDHDDRGVAQLRAEVLDQVELRRSRPVDVLENEKRWLRLAEALDHPAHREKHESLVHPWNAGSEPEQQSEVARRIHALRGRNEPRDPLVELFAGDLRWVRVEDPERLPHDLGRCVVPGPLLVRQTPSPERTPSTGADLRGDLAAQPRLSDAGRPDHGDQVRPRVGRRLAPHRADEVDLARPADERAERLRPFGRLRDHARREPRLDRCAPCPSRPTQEAPRTRLRASSPGVSRGRRPGCRRVRPTAAVTPCSPRPRSRALLRHPACSRSRSPRPCSPPHAPRARSLARATPRPPRAPSGPRALLALRRRCAPPVPRTPPSPRHR